MEECTKGTPVSETLPQGISLLTGNDSTGAPDSLWLRAPLTFSVFPHYFLCVIIPHLWSFLVSMHTWFAFTHSKKCWVKYNPALGKIWTNPANGLFSTKKWVTCLSLPAGSKQANRWVCPYFTQLRVMFNPAFFRMYSHISLTEIAVIRFQKELAISV